jgi:hypothetical protein
MVSMTKLDLPRYLKLRRMHDSLYVTIPREYVYAHDLNAHDDILWLPTEDGIKLKFVQPAPSPAGAP